MSKSEADSAGLYHDRPHKAVGRGRAARTAERPLRAWIVWSPGKSDGGVVVYAKTRSAARWSGANEMGCDDWHESLSYKALRAPLADHLAESGKQPDAALMSQLGFAEVEQ